MSGRGEVKRVQEVATSFSTEMLQKPCQVLAVNKIGNEWKVLIEVVEEKGFIDDLLGAYEITLDEQMNATSYERKGLRRRTDTAPQPWQKTD